MAIGSRAKSGPSKALKTGRRREELRRVVPRQTLDLRSIVQQPEFVNTALVVTAFVVVASMLAVWSREDLKVAVDDIMTRTRLKRLDYRVPDTGKTSAQRTEARESAPHVYVLNDAYLDRLAAALNGLPIAVAGKTSITEINPEVREQFQLTEAGLTSLAPFAAQGETTQDWRKWVDALIWKQLPGNPLLSSDVYQNQWTDREYSAALKRMLRQPLGDSTDLKEIRREAEAIELPADVETPLKPGDHQRLATIVQGAGFPPEVVPYITARLAHDPQPTLFFNQEESNLLADRAEAAVPTSFHEHHKGEVIFSRGDKLSLTQYREAMIEAEQFAVLAPFTEKWMPRVAIAGLLSFAAVFIVGYVGIFYPRVVRNSMRLVALCGLVASMLALTAIVGVKAPSVMLMGAVAPTLFVAIVALLAYDQRLALFLGAMQSALAAFALEQRIGMFLLLFAGCGVAVAQLREMRHRSDLIQASTVTAAVLFAGGILLGLLEIPLVKEPDAWTPWKQILFRGFWSGFGAFAVGFVVLGMLPSLESWFDITTGMTLAELRDPKQPLLKQLQQKAPGTYNHSLQVANIAEAAAEAIGANGLLVYVGALYHDIGKMNKPDYFVENQPQGVSRHDKLSPAMSLLVIVGHVKDGIELSREYGLPRKIQHFIESHHGTTLVEYFYHAAKSQAEGSHVAEIEFRYPGPKPRTKEAAILMLADAVESATRSMADPNPARIDNLVRTLSRKRLVDGQYDQSDLTFRELSQIEDSTIKILCAIYHGRITYPGQQKEKPRDQAAPETPEPVAAKSASA